MPHTYEKDKYIYLLKEVFLLRSQGSTNGGGEARLGLAWRRHPLPPPPTPGGGVGREDKGWNPALIHCGFVQGRNIT